MTPVHQRGTLTIAIGGKPRTLSFNFRALSLIESVTPLTAIDQLSVYNLLILLTWAGLKATKGHELPDDFSLEDAGDYLMEANPVDTAQILPTYTEAMGFMLQLAGVGEAEGSPAPSA